MEKPLPQQHQHGVRAKKSFLKYLPKAASAVSFYNHPVFSPGRDKRSSYGCHYNTHNNNTHSGPLFPLIPDEVRRKPRKEDQDGQQQQEPGSPKVSCIGQIKMHHKTKKKIIHTKKNKKKDFSTSASGVYFEARDNEQAASAHLHRRRRKQDEDVLQGDRFGKSEEEKGKKKGEKRGATKKQSSKILRIFGGSFGSRATTTARKCHNHKSDKSTGAASGSGSLSSNKSSSSVPSLGQMRRFASGRQALSNFDWSAPQIAPLNNDLDHHRNCHSDEELSRGDGEEEEEEDYEFDDDEEEVIIPFSAPIVVQRTGDDDVFVEPAKEINLWQRRNTTSPPPLQLKPIKVRAR